jgi:hypothetical protein
MQHFPEETLIDFLHGFSGSATTREIQSHLGNSCADCRTALGRWNAVMSFAVRERSYTPPENLVRMAKLEFSMRHAVEPDAVSIASLIFDSMKQPLTAGIRSAAASMQHLVYEVEGLSVHLSFERRPDATTIFAMGQVLDKQAPLAWLGNATVVLWSDKGLVVTMAETNGYGEFQLEFEPQNHLRLTIATIDRKTVRIPLGNLE